MSVTVDARKNLSSPMKCLEKFTLRVVNAKSPIDFNESRISLLLMSKTKVIITNHNLIKREEHLE